MFNWGQVRVSPQNGAQYMLVSSKATFVKFKSHMSGVISQISIFQKELFILQGSSF